MVDNYFKDEVEIRQFFKNCVFEFEFQVDYEIYFKTTIPLTINGEIFDFKISFYNKGETAFANYSRFSDGGKHVDGDWLDCFQISEVTSISISSNDKKTLYHSMYDENNKNNNN